MNLLENVREGLISIKANLLRSVLTALIIAIGISALVGILTAIDAIKGSVDDNLGSLGSRTFDIDQKYQQSGRRRRFGRKQSTVRTITYSDASRFKRMMARKAVVSLSLSVSGNAEFKSGANKTNPNISVTGIDENFLKIKQYDLAMGRGFTETEVDYGTPVGIIGSEVAKTLFKESSPLNQLVYYTGGRFLVVGILSSKGKGQGSSSNDRQIYVPITYARNHNSSDRNLSANISVLAPNVASMNNLMAEAQGVMRQVRRDKVGQADTFEITRSESLARGMNEVTGYLQLAGFVIGFVTLLGASIGLMNIMLVSVTERTREIGIRKALGATQSLIRAQFLIEAIVICQLGGILGVGLGLVMGNAVSIFTGSGHFIVPWLWIGVAIVICIIVGVLSGFYPAWKASKLDPIEALRYE
jgi:putative ABC transport system permease protein